MSSQQGTPSKGRKSRRRDDGEQPPHTPPLDDDDEPRRRKTPTSQGRTRSQTHSQDPLPEGASSQQRRLTPPTTPTAGPDPFTTPTRRTPNEISLERLTPLVDRLLEGVQAAHEDQPPEDSPTAQGTQAVQGTQAARVISPYKPPFRRRHGHGALLPPTASDNDVSSSDTQTGRTGLRPMPASSTQGLAPHMRPSWRTQPNTGGATASDAEAQPQQVSPSRLVWNTVKNTKVFQKKLSGTAEGNKRSMFAQGAIIRLTHHSPNLDRKAQESGMLKKTALGGVFSKKRWAIVLWKFDRQMMVVPIYSHDKKGITKHDARFYHEFVEITNAKDVRRYPKVGVHDVLGADMRPDFQFDSTHARKSCVSMAKAFSVDYQEKIEIIGDLTRESRSEMQTLMLDFVIQSIFAD